MINSMFGSGTINEFCKENIPNALISDTYGINELKLHEFIPSHLSSGVDIANGYVDTHDDGPRQVIRVDAIADLALKMPKYDVTAIICCELMVAL